MLKNVTKNLLHWRGAKAVPVHPGSVESGGKGTGKGINNQSRPGRYRKAWSKRAV